MTEKQPRILIIGGGFGGLFAVLDLAGTGDITLVSDEDHFLFAPMLYEYLSGEVQAWHIAPDYKELLEESVHFVKGVVSAIDLDRREVTIEGRPEKLSYDVLALAVGGVTNYWGVEGAEQFTLPFRKLAHANALRRRMTKGLLLQGSYVWSHAISNEFSNGIGGSFSTLRNFSIDKAPSPYDIRQAVKLNWIYELPFGTGRHWMANAPGVVNAILGGWSIQGFNAMMTGTPYSVTSGARTAFFGSGASPPRRRPASSRSLAPSSVSSPE